MHNDNKLTLQGFFEKYIEICSPKFLQQGYYLYKTNALEWF